VFRQFFQALKKGGNYVFDYLNKPHVIENLIPYERDQVGDIQLELERHIAGSRVEKRISLIKQNHTSVFYESVKMYTSQEIFRMLQSVGLKVNYTFGNYNGRELRYNSPRLIIIGEKS
jgi:hypothetical protein